MNTTKANLDCLRVYLITDRSLLQGKKLLDGVRQALEGGVRSIQLREKDLPKTELLGLTKEMITLTRSFGAKLFINHHADLAHETGADGVHLTESSPRVEEIKTQFPDLLIGVSTHSLESARIAERSGADFITFSPVFETPSKRAYGEPQGLDKLEEVAGAIHIPALALGGIKLDNASTAIKRRSFGIALISGILASQDIRETSHKFIKLFSGETS